MGKINDNSIIYQDIIEGKIVSADLYNKKIRIENKYDLAFDINESLKPAEANVLSFLNEKRSHKRNVVFGIVTTYQCNLSCLYCYEKNYQNKAGVLSSKMCEDICQYIIKYVDYYKVENVKLIFTGGEPTINMNAILIISRHLSYYFKLLKVNLSFSIVTNGTIDISKYLNELRSYGLDLIQISLDGPRQIHNLRRISKFDAYERSLKFLRYCAKNEIPSVIRTNIDNQNIEYLQEMLSEIGDLSQKEVTLSLYQTEKTICERSITKSFLIDTDTVIRAYSIAKKYGFRINKGNPFWGGCMSLIPVGQFIDPRGEIYKCGGMIGHDNEVVGTIYDFDGMITSVERYIDNKINNDCMKCKMFPACAGGCIYNNHYTESCNKSFKLYMYKKIRMRIIIYLLDKGVIKAVDSV